MSLVNQMLKDLESRRAPEMGGEAVLSDLSVAPPRSPAISAIRRLLWVGLLIVVIGGGGWYWYSTYLPAAMSISNSESVVMLQGKEAVSQTSAVASVAVESRKRSAVVATRPPNVPETKPTSELKLTAGKVDFAPLQAPTSPAPKAEVARVGERERVPTVTPPKKEVTVPQAVATSQRVVESRRKETKPVIERVKRPRSSRERAQLAFHKGVDLVRRGQLIEAETPLRSALSLDPDLTEAREVLAALLIRSQRSAEAETLLKTGLERNSSAYSLARIYGRLLVERGEQETAIDILETSLPEPVMDPEFYGLLAALYQRTEQHGKATEAYRRVLAVAPERGAWWTGLGISLERLQRSVEAQQAYRRARGTAGMGSQLLSFVDSRLAALETD